MILPDANLLLYAHNEDAPEHARAREWVENVLNGTEPVLLTWTVLLAFIRIGTSRVFERPLPREEALAIVAEWLALPVVVLTAPSERHWLVFHRLVLEAQCHGPLITDAHLAALAIEHGATLYSTDGDFARFANLRWVNPLLRP